MPGSTPYLPRWARLLELRSASAWAGLLTLTPGMNRSDCTCADGGADSIVGGSQQLACTQLCLETARCLPMLCNKL